MEATPEDTHSFTFDKIELEKVERSYSEVNMSDIQKQTTRTVAAIHARNLGISEVTTRGFINFAISDWQKESHLLAEEYYKLAKEEQAEALSRIAEFFYERVSRIVPKTQHYRLKRSIMEAHREMMKIYKL